jgi:DNA replication protein DnaC
MLNGMDDDSSPESTPISSNTDQPCGICGQRALCGGLGYVRYELPVDHADFGKLFRCPNNHYVDPERREKLRKLGNLDAFTEKTFDTFKTDLPMLTPTQRQSLETALSIARSYASSPDGWLLLEGTYGCGKTHLAAAVGNARLDYEDTVLFITTPDLLDHLRNTYSSSSDLGYDEMFDRLKTAPLLILDDLGVENPSGWAQEKLFQLLNFRHSRRMPTIITTNVDLEMLDPRVRSRLLDDSVIRRVRISALDYRTPVQSQNDQLSNLALYRDMTFATFDAQTGVTAEQKQNLERALAIARSYAEQPQDWLVFFGNYGCGKTHLAAAIANYQQERGNQVLFVTVPDLLDYLRLTFSPGATGNFDRRFQTVRNASLLILDDVGTESATAWAKEKLFQIISYRYIGRLPTLLTTSKALEELDERLQSRLLDQRRCTRFAITAPAYASRLYRK